MKTWRENNLIYNMKGRMYEDNIDIFTSLSPEITNYIDKSLEKALRKVMKSYRSQGRGFESSDERDDFLERAFDYILDGGYGRIETLKDAQDLDYEHIVEDIIINDYYGFS